MESLAFAIPDFIQFLLDFVASVLLGQFGLEFNVLKPKFVHRELTVEYMTTSVFLTAKTAVLMLIGMDSRAAVLMDTT
jgi:hypothetical protein